MDTDKGTDRVKKISVLIPTYNEEAVLDELFKRLCSLAKKNQSYKFEFLFVNDGSEDATLAKIKKYARENTAVSYVNLSRNFGKEVAMIAGLDHIDADATVIIDADLQDPPELIPNMIALWEEGYDDVYARRNDRLGESWVKKFTSKLFYRTLQRSTRIPIQQDTGDFRLLDRRCIAALTRLRENQRYTKGMFSWIGFNKKEIIYSRHPRLAGKSKWNYWRLLDLAIEGITSFTTAPLRWSSLAGTIVSVAAFIYILVILMKTLLFGSDVAGYPSLMAVILFLGGVQLLSLGIMGEYIARIFNETKNRPLYFVEEYYAGSSSIKK